MTWQLVVYPTFVLHTYDTKAILAIRFAHNTAVIMSDD